VDAILEADGRLNNTCTHCKVGEANWKCLGCLGQPVFCTGCCRRLHHRNPFHRVKQWTGTHWAPSWLIGVGIEIHLGHGGNQCPCPGTWNRVNNEHDDEADEWDDDGVDDIPPVGENMDGAPSSEALQIEASTPLIGKEDESQLLTIVDISGVHRLIIRPCGCHSNEDTDDIQLLKMGFFAASFSRIRTVFTLRVLDDYRRDNLVCNTTAYQYFKKIRRVTSPAFPHTVPVSLLTPVIVLVSLCIEPIS
jgi:CxC2 like cysteine cluster associated with KDZ transposases